MNEQLPAFNRRAVKPIQCLTEGWQMVKGRYWLFVGICLVGTLIGSAAPMAILAGPMMCGIYFCLFRQDRGEPIKFEMLFRGFDYFVQSLIATLILVVPLMVILIPAYFAIILLMISSSPPPGGKPNPNFSWAMLGGMGAFYVLLFMISLVISILFYFIYPLIVDRELTGVQAVKTSFRAAMGNFGGLLALVLLTNLLAVAGMLVCCIGAYFVLPIQLGAVIATYKKVFPPEEAVTPPSLEGPEADYGPQPGADDY